MSLYTELGVTKSATLTEIKKAYRKLVLEVHPDAGGDAERFKRVSSAYSVLSDPAKRAAYDAPAIDMIWVFSELSW